MTLDDDVVLTIKEEMTKGGGKTFKEAVNGLIRRARLVQSADARSGKPFKLKGRSLRSHADIDFDCISKLLEELDSPRR